MSPGPRPHDPQALRMRGSWRAATRTPTIFTDRKTGRRWLLRRLRPDERQAVIAAAVNDPERESGTIGGDGAEALLLAAVVDERGHPRFEDWAEVEEAIDPLDEAAVGRLLDAVWTAAGFIASDWRRLRD